MQPDYQIQLILALVGTVLSLVTGVLALVRDFRSLAYRAFACGMAALAVETILSLFIVNSGWRIDALMWGRTRLAVSALIPGCWLLFSLCYARQNYREFVKGWRWTLVVSFALPVISVLVCGNYLLLDAEYLYETKTWVLSLGPSGYAFYLLLLIFSVLIAFNLEKTLRTSYGSIRWQIKFTILGIGLLFAARVYTASETLLFRMIDTGLFTVNNSVLVIGNGLLIVSAVRNRLRDVNVYVSQGFLNGSFALLGCGLYLLVVGVAAKLAVYLGISNLLLQNGLIGLVALLGVAALLLSVNGRYKLRMFVHRHFQRPFYDYRKIWTDFAQKTGSLVDVGQLCTAIAVNVSETFLTTAVSIWLVDGDSPRVVLAGSTAFSIGETGNEAEEKALTPLVAEMRGKQAPVDLNAPGLSPGLAAINGALEQARIRYCAPLSAGGEFVGVLTMNSRTGPPFSNEDFELLKTLADQSAVLILNHKLFESLARTKEMNAFQDMSAFFMHDLKNVASTLALTLQNLPVHYEDPEFRKDVLKMISAGKEKIQKVCGQLSTVGRNLELKRCECDLNELVKSTLSGLTLRSSIVCDLEPIPLCFLDPEQMRTVLLNVVLNANDAVTDQGEIRISTYRDGASLVLSVKDNGCGMSGEFLKNDLFRPFRTTKSGGSGIGLFQSRLITEAHGGRLQVHSLEKKGSTFQIILPLD